MNDYFSVITGCNRGIGKATLTKFACEGKNIVTVTRKADNEFEAFTDSLSKSYGITILNYYADFMNENDVLKCARDIAKKKIKINSLINNIGVALPQKSFFLTKMSTIKEVFQINFFSPLIFTQSIARLMMRDGGSIVFVTSVSAYDGGGNIEYSGSKAAIIGEVHRLALELNQYNIRVNGVAPGLTDTDMAQTMNEDDIVVALNMNIMNRLGKPDEIANVVYFLASDQSSFMTGQIIRADGGIR